jgi:hypothetical protein
MTAGAAARGAATPGRSGDATKLAEALVCTARRRPAARHALAAAADRLFMPQNQHKVVPMGRNSSTTKFGNLGQMQKPTPIFLSDNAVRARDDGMEAALNSAKC